MVLYGTRAAVRSVGLVAFGDGLSPPNYYRVGALGIADTAPSLLFAGPEDPPALGDPIGDLGCCNAIAGINEVR